MSVLFDKSSALEKSFIRTFIGLLYCIVVVNSIGGKNASGVG